MNNEKEYTNQTSKADSSINKIVGGRKKRLQIKAK